MLLACSCREMKVATQSERLTKTEELQNPPLLCANDSKMPETERWSTSHLAAWQVQGKWGQGSRRAALEEEGQNITARAGNAGGALRGFATTFR